VSDYYEDDNDHEDGGPADLRAALKKAKAQAAAAEKRAAELEAEKATLSAQVKKSSLADLLKQAGVDPKFAARADKDGADASEDGVKAWIEENKDFYNFGGTKPAEVEVVEKDGAPNVSPDLEAGVRASQALSESGIAPGEVDILQKIQSIPTEGISEDQFLAQLKSLGMEVG
jgi:hypothetical protein